MNIDSDTIGRVFDESWTHRIAFIVIIVIAVLFLLFILSMKKQEWKEKKSRRKREEEEALKEAIREQEERDRDPYEAVNDLFRDNGRGR